MPDPKRRSRSKPRVVSFVNQKGGAGKTTIAIHLATIATAAGHNVLVLDLDPQISASEWRDHRRAELPAVESIQHRRLPHWLERAAEIGAHLIVIDTAPHSNDIATQAIEASDLVLVPVRPEIIDLRAVTKTTDLLKVLKAKAFAVLNTVPPRGTDADEAAATLTAMGLSVAPCRLGKRMAFSRSQITGQAASEVEPDGKATAEIRALYEWVCGQVGLPTVQCTRLAA
jgi:chromosome partitioning protein